MLNDGGLGGAAGHVRNALARLDAVDDLDLAQGSARQQQRLHRHDLGRAVELDELPRHFGARGHGLEPQLELLVHPQTQPALDKVKLLGRERMVRVDVGLERQVAPLDKPRRDFRLEPELRNEDRVFHQRNEPPPHRPRGQAGRLVERWDVPGGRLDVELGGDADALDVDLALLLLLGLGLGRLVAHGTAEERFGPRDAAARGREKRRARDA